MSVTGTVTNFDICTDALRKLGIVAHDTTATDDEMATATRALNRMLKAWQNQGLDLWLTASTTVTLTTAASYTLDPVRPLSVDSVRLKRGGIETPMQKLTRREYDELPLKASTGLPTCFYYDRQREAARLYVWPVLAVAGGQTLAITYTREIADVVASEVADIPAEWYDATVYGLASRLADDFMVNAPNITARAERELDLALSFDREGSVWFVDC
jgi:hypothetical protein